MSGDTPAPVEVDELDDDAEAPDDGRHIFDRLALPASMRRKLVLIQSVYRLPNERSAIRAVLHAGLPALCKQPIPAHLVAQTKKGGAANERRAP